MKRLILTLALAGSFLSSCISIGGESVTASNAFLLAEKTSEDGVRTKYRVQAQREGPSILRVETDSLDVAYLGVTTRSLTRSYAEPLGVKAWRGVRVTSVSGQSAASAAGLQVGDILVSIAGEELGSVEEFQEVVAEMLEPGTSTTAVVARRDAAGDPVEETIEITPGSRTIEDSTTERIGLDAPPAILKQTGMQVATVEAELANEVGLSESSVALVTSVVPGASAYNEGVRAGDRILECNGAPVARASDIQRALSSETLELFVDGPLGEHHAKVRTDQNVDSRRRFHIPIVVDYTSRVDRTRTSFLDFIFQFGFNYRRTVGPSRDREPAKETYLSLFPLGMFEFERSAKHSRNTLFWLITWSSRK